MNRATDDESLAAIYRQFEDERLAAIRRQFEERVLAPRFAEWLRGAKAAGLVPEDLAVERVEFHWPGPAEVLGPPPFAAALTLHFDLRRCESALAEMLAVDPAHAGQASDYNYAAAKIDAAR